AVRFPGSRFTAISNAPSQRDHIAGEAHRRGLANVTVRTADRRSLALADGGFDRVLSIEMFEHMRNYQVLLRRIAGWLAPGGALFVHVFAHQRHASPVEDAVRAHRNG